MLDEQELRRMSPQERLRVRQTLATLDEQDLTASGAGERRRQILLAAIVVCCVVLAAWIGVLAATLPRYYRAGGWRGAWVGFDLAELVVFVVTGWAAYRRRQILIICLVVLATLLCCDAWFDVVLDARTKGFLLSLLSAVLIELPLAAVAILLARRLMRTTNAVLLRSQGVCGPVPRLRKIPLVGINPSRPFSDVLAEPSELMTEHAELTAEVDSGHRQQ
ncbi:MAG TPA: hypothetical protein VMB74_19115 [Streptosporangiaceae bacterium]|nr:hypothetical protein [Streptosporangiaceae bacterium]